MNITTSLRLNMTHRRLIEDNLGSVTLSDWVRCAMAAALHPNTEAVRVFLSAVSTDALAVWAKECIEEFERRPTGVRTPDSDRTLTEVAMMLGMVDCTEEELMSSLRERLSRAQFADNMLEHFNGEVGR